MILVCCYAAGGDAKAPPSTLQASFAVTRDLLFVMLSRELLVFDLELGHPAASIPLPPKRPAFSHFLGVFGEGVSQGLGDEGGIEFMYCAHQDGNMSVWVRTPSELMYRMSSMTRLTPAPVRGSGPSGQVRDSAHTGMCITVIAFHGFQNSEKMCLKTGILTADATHHADYGVSFAAIGCLVRVHVPTCIVAETSST